MICLRSVDTSTSVGIPLWMNVKKCSTFLEVDVVKDSLWTILLYEFYQATETSLKVHYMYYKESLVKKIWRYGQKSKKSVCKITVPDIAVLLCIEVVNALYVEENTALHLHCTRSAVDAGCCFDSWYGQLDAVLICLL